MGRNPTRFDLGFVTMSMEGSEKSSASTLSHILPKDWPSQEVPAALCGKAPKGRSQWVTPGPDSIDCERCSNVAKRDGLYIEVWW